MTAAIPLGPRARSYVHRGGLTPLLGQTIDAWFSRVARAVPESDAIVCRPQRVRLTYAQLDREVQRVARGLLGLGVVRGERVGVWSTNNLEWLLLQIATARIGAVLVNINPAYQRGENIYPAEIEALYFGHPKVADVAVFGVPDTKMGEEVGAWICLHEGERADPDELRDYVRGKLSHFKVPRYIWIVDEFPMTVNGKIQKFKIREIVAGRLQPP